MCTDVLYRIPSNHQNIDWIHPFNETDDIFSFRRRHPNVRFHLSIDDTFLSATVKSHHQVNRLIAFLKETGSISLDVLVNPQTDLAALSQVLRRYQRILLNHFMGLTITTHNDTDINSIVENAIDRIVDGVFFIPSVKLTSDGDEINISPIKRLLPSNKLVIGLPSIVFIEPDLNNHFRAPTVTELCSNLNEWQPSIGEDDQVMWRHEKRNWKFAMRMGRAIEHQIANIYSNSSNSNGIFLFDVTFRFQDGPICSRHTALFLKIVRQAAGRLDSNRRQKRVKRLSAELSHTLLNKPTAKPIRNMNRTGKILIFSVGDEEEQFRKYYSIHDKNSPVPNPFVHLVLGYDDSGKIYDIYQQMPPELNEEFILNTIHQYYVDKILGGGGESVLGSIQLQPPEILVYPGFFDHHPVPILITWVKMADSMIRLMPRKTRKPSTQQTELLLSSTTTAPLSSTAVTEGRLCIGGQNTPFQRCFVPAGLMELLNLGIGLSTTTTSTRKPTTMRQTTAKPAIQVYPHARLSEGEAEMNTVVLEEPDDSVSTHTSELASSTSVGKIIGIGL